MPLPTERLDRILFVTQRFGELRGLVSVSLGAAAILGVVTWSLLPWEFRNVFQNVAFLAVVGGLCAIFPIESYYDSWYGRAPMGRSHAAGGDSRPFRAETTGALVMQLAFGLDMVKGFVHPGGGSVAAAGLAGYSLWVLVRDWRHRPYYILGLAAGVAGLAITWAVPMGMMIQPHRYPAVAVPYAINYALVGLALVFVGLLDHGLLARAMQPAGEGRAVRAPDGAASALRALVSGLCLLVLCVYIAIAGWPEQSLFLYWALYLTIMIGLIVVHTRRRRRTVAASERARENRLAAKVAALRGEAAGEHDSEAVADPTSPRYDVAGHLVLPLALACGALADIALRGAGTPSLLAAALAGSHLRIALRDWPARGYYLLGSLAASISAVHFMFLPQHQALDWTIWFLILVCAAMLVEGLLDYRLSKTAEDFSKEHHADAI